YFYNQSVKAKGYGDFKSKWGNRPNVDNWQVQSLINQQITGLTPASSLLPNGQPNGATAPAAQLTAESLMAGLPLTPEKMQKSKDSVETALFVLGRALQDYIPDYRSALKVYDTLQTKFPDTKYYQESLYNQYFCYIHLEDSVNAARILALMKQKFPSGRYIALIENPPKGPGDMPARTRATEAYETVYEHFIEGHFDQAAAEKIKLDSVFGDRYWTPQLLYIEALYYIHYRYDSIGKVTLNKIITHFPKTIMSAKAENVLRVLNERERIETYLSNLHVQRMADDSIARLAIAAAQPKITDSAKNAKAKALNAQNMEHDSSQISIKKPDALQLKAQSLFVSPFIWSPDKPQYVVMVMTNVDPVYVTESKNAFDRYNRENFYGKNYEIDKQSLTDTSKLMVVQGFGNVGQALTYLNKAGNAAPREIIPWLPEKKYFFIIIDGENLEILKANKDIQLYRRFLSVYSPDSFPAGK
ncbi:MAG TPA: hypothetical protein VGH64_10980, partial [Puia sp.]